jgi:4'-phosphopantetheinyl transferase
MLRSESYGPIRWPAPPDSWSLGENDTHVWAASLLLTPDALDKFAVTLAPDEHERAARFFSSRDQDRFVAARGLVRAMLGKYLGIEPADSKFAYGPNGKPTLAGALAGHELHFNVAHSEDLALFAFSRAGSVGVDLERLRPLDDAGELAARFFSRSESAVLLQYPEDEQIGAFFDLWTRKEAWLKATGEGITSSLDVPLPASTSGWRLQKLSPAPGFVGALALDLRSSPCASKADGSPPPRIDCWRWLEVVDL